MAFSQTKSRRGSPPRSQKQNPASPANDNGVKIGPHLQNKLKLLAERVTQKIISPITCQAWKKQDDGELLANRYMPLELARQRWLEHLLCHAPDIFRTIDVSICVCKPSCFSWLGEKEWVSRRRYQTIEWRMVWQAFFYCCRREALSVDGQFEPHFVCQWEFCNIQSSGLLSKRPEKKRNSLYHSLKDWDSRPAIVLPQLFLDL